MDARANARLACESLLAPSALFPPLRGLTLEPAPPAPPPAHEHAGGGPDADDAGLPVSQLEPALVPALRDELGSCADADDAGFPVSQLAPAPSPALQLLDEDGSADADDAGLPGVVQSAPPSPALPLRDEHGSRAVADADDASLPVSQLEPRLPALPPLVPAARPAVPVRVPAAAATAAAAVGAGAAAAISSPARIRAAPLRGVPAPSSEQQSVLGAFFEPSVQPNILLRACAGSGKTTMALQLAAELRERGSFILMLTFSAALKEDVDRAAVASGLDRNCLDVRTFHSLCRKWYQPWRAAGAAACPVTDDAEMERVVATDAPPLPSPSALPRLAAIFIDEAQDVSEFVYRFLLKFFADCARAQGGARPQLVVAGDARQAVHSFRGADARFLTLAGRLWENGRPWAMRTLSTTYRLPGNVATLLNACAAPLEAGTAAAPLPLRPHKGAGAPVTLYLGSEHKAASYLAKELVQRIKSGQVRCEDVLVIARSVNKAPPARSRDDDGARRGGGSKPLAVFDAELERAGIASHVPAGADARGGGGGGGGAGDIARGKVQFSTMASAKGRQARYVYVLEPLTALGGREYAGLGGAEVLTADFFVSYSRASERLFMLGEASADDVHPCLPWAVREQLRQARVLDVKTFGYRSAGAPPPRAGAAGAAALGVGSSGISRALVASELALYTCAVALERIRRSLRWTHEAPARPPLAVVSTLTLDGGRSYDVSAHTGLALPAALEREAHIAASGRDDCALLAALDAAARPRGELPAALHAHARALMATPTAARGAAWHSELAALSIAGVPEAGGIQYVSRYTWLRPSRFDWLHPAVFEAGVADLKAAIPRWAAADFEVKLAHEGADFVLSGRADVLAPDMLVELKAITGCLTTPHMLQLATYASLFLRSKRGLLALADADAAAAGSPRAPASAALPAFILLNAVTGERWQLHCENSADAAAVHAAVDALVALKLASPLASLEDEMFVDKMLAPSTSQPLPAAAAAAAKAVAEPPTSPSATAAGDAAADAEYDGAACLLHAGSRRSRAEAGLP